MVGHTHDDIDQMFSRFSTKLAAAPHIVYSVPQFMDLLKSGFDPEPDVFFLREVNDWKTELDKFSQNVFGRHVVHAVIYARFSTRSRCMRVVRVN